ncbi:MAG: RagB/SusD family nutrient uptake outer membrane protein, partial [Tannerella sp.]|nr:RagB/SusD family nutrient uptake outer membrane protein [Tannerella sp.]
AAGTGWDWAGVRSINYFLSHYRDAEASVTNPAQLDKWKAEALFFKAWDYYRKVFYFGDVPWLSHDLNVDSPELYAPRTPRAEVMDSVLSIINFAVAHIKDGGEADGRINRDMANFLKARICLFEGTFRKYHTELNLPYEKFLTECVTACEDIIATGRYELYRDPNIKNSYWKLFTFKGRPSTDGNREAILARTYDGVNVGHCTQRYYAFNSTTRFVFGASKSLVDEYLCIDGKPIAGNPLFKGYDGADWRELDNRDPRLKQTVAKPGEYITVYSGGNINSGNPSGLGKMDSTLNGIRYPILNYNDNGTNDGRPGTTATGYQFIKHWMGDLALSEIDAVTEGTQTALEFRYGEVLLMLAEAKTELGSITNSDLDRTVNKLRERAGFDFNTYPDSKLTVVGIADPVLDARYAEKLGYMPSPLLREIRRERRVELAMEGFRYEDLVRWKAGRLYTVPVRGIKFTAEKQALYDGTHNSWPVFANLAILNTDIFVDEEGFIIGYPRSSGVTNGILPWDDRRYYFPIPLQELTINKALTQNRGWEDVK